MNFILDLTQEIFTLLEDECKKRIPSTSNLHHMIIRACEDKIDFNIKKKTNMTKSPENLFVIHHFSKDVYYSTVIYIIIDKLFLFNIINNSHCTDKIGKICRKK